MVSTASLAHSSLILPFRKKSVLWFRLVVRHKRSPTKSPAVASLASATLDTRTKLLQMVTSPGHLLPARCQLAFSQSSVSQSSVFTTSCTNSIPSPYAPSKPSQLKARILTFSQLVSQSAGLACFSHQHTSNSNTRLRQARSRQWSVENQGPENILPPARARSRYLLPG
jgi:hypothetical protein